MAKRPRTDRPDAPEPKAEVDGPPPAPRAQRRARRLAGRGDLAAARRMLRALRERAGDPRSDALILNDLAALTAGEGDPVGAAAAFREALALDPECLAARLNLALLEADAEPRAAEAPSPAAPVEIEAELRTASIRVMILSLLFNWPSTGGGIVHTVELAKFLGEAGYNVRHVHARYEPWGIGRVEGAPPFSSSFIEFDEASWNVAAVRERFRREVVAFDPDVVVVTDSWNSKPILAEAAAGYPYILRLQALECLCPLNNVRLLPDGEGGFRQCRTHQLADPDACRACLVRNGSASGALHQAEREFCGVGTEAYRATLVRAFRAAAAVLVVNPLTEAMVEPHAGCVRTVTAGMDPTRFPESWPVEPTDGRPGDGRMSIVFAGLAREPMKGFAVLHEACSRLWDRRRDFELVVTDDPPGRLDPFTRFVGWLDQETLPRYLRAADVVAVPTIAQEALGRTAVEALAAGRPVVAGRIGGLPFTVVDGATGLLFEPGDPDDLAAALERLLDDPALRERLGQAGRRRFEERYAWPVIVERDYRPLLKRRDRDAGNGAAAGYVPRPATGDEPYEPFIPDRVDPEKLVDDVARFLGRDRDETGRRFRRYREFHESRGYARTLGELKTLCFEEAFVLGEVLDLIKPRTIAEVGVFEGKSTRRLLDLLRSSGLEARVVGFDLADRRRYVAEGEAEFVEGDLTGRFRERVLEALRPELVLLDAHPHALLREAIELCMAGGGPAALLVHDCGRGLCRRRMTLSRDDPGVTSATGVWERHVLAELFGFDDPLDPGLDVAETATRRLRIFDTPHGLGLILPRR